MTLVTKIVIALLIFDALNKLTCLAKQEVMCSTPKSMAIDAAIHALLVTLLLMGY